MTRAAPPDARSHAVVAVRRSCEAGWGWTVAKVVGVGVLYLIVFPPALVISMFATSG